MINQINDYNYTHDSTSIGLAKDWLPSLRSVDNQIGALSIVLDGQVLSVKFIVGWNFLYLTEGSLLYSASYY